MLAQKSAARLGGVNRNSRAAHARLTARKLVKVRQQQQ